MFQLCGWLPTATLATASELYGTVAVVGGGATVVAAAEPATPVLDEVPVTEVPCGLVGTPLGGPPLAVPAPAVVAVPFPPLPGVPVPLTELVGTVATVVVTPCDVLGGGGAFGSWALHAPTSSAMARGTAATRRCGRRRAEYLKVPTPYHCDRRPTFRARPTPRSSTSTHTRAGACEPARTPPHSSTGTLTRAEAREPAAPSLLPPPPRPPAPANLATTLPLPPAPLRPLPAASWPPRLLPSPSQLRARARLLDLDSYAWSHLEVRLTKLGA